MKVELKTWSALTLATALAGAGLAGCSGEAGAGGEGGEAAQTSQSGEGGEGEGGEGEGGVDISAANSDPVVYGTALAIAQAHVLAARDAYLAGNTEAAAEMFGHPVAEVLADMAPVFAQLGVDDMTGLFTEASQAALADAGDDAITGHVDTILAALAAAAEKAPDNGTSDARIAAGIAADQIERAVSMYAGAAETGEYGPYLDGYGFYRAALASFEGSADAIRAEDEALHSSLAAALELLGEAYPSATQPASLDANQGALSGASSSVQLGLS